MQSQLTTQKDGHVNPYKVAVKDHVPQAGDYYSVRSPHYNTRNIFRLEERTVNKYGGIVWKIKTIIGPRDEETISEDSLKEYYRPLLGDFKKISKYAFMVVDGHADQMAAALMPKKETTPADTQELMASGSPQQIAAMLDESERMQNMLEEIKLTADIIIENKKAKLEAKLGAMDKYLSGMMEQVKNLMKIITVLNLYTGKTITLEQICDGDPADPSEPLHLRQRILYMDEELCVHLDHEADYNDIDLFKDWLKEPQNRDVIVPEQRCIVALKPKHNDYDYRSGDPRYDAERNIWNKHTYLLLRNGEKLFMSESEDLELFDWAFPHSDFEEKFQKDMADPQTYFKDSLRQTHDNIRYRTTKYMVYLQGIIDTQQDILGPMRLHPNLMKQEGAVLVRDDESLIGTGRLPWREFVNEKNKSIRIGTRIVFVQGRTFFEHGRYKRYDGEFMKYYAYEGSMPPGPCSGIYSMEPYYDITGYQKGKPVRSDTPTLVFRYLPGDDVWYRNENGWFDTRKRTKRVAWKPSMGHVINYDAITLEEMRGYMEDRTLRESFRDMMPLLKKTLLQKEAETKDEQAFKELVANRFHQETGMTVCLEVLDEAIAWWKEKVIYTRPLRSDDAKAFRMIMKYIKKVNT